MQQSDNLLDMQGITKYYPGVVALDNVSLSVKKGEVHALLGENGAGKSTLIKILAGSVESDTGKIIFDGKEYSRYSPHFAMEIGISVIYQEFNLVPMMTVENNIHFGKEVKKGLFADEKQMLENTAEVFRRMGVSVNPKEQICNLSIAYQQLTEIAKAISNDAKLIVMDEPSATLTNKELTTLFDLIRKLKADGASVIYISHRLEEIFEIADRVTVLRDGKYVDTKNVKDTNKSDLIHMMVGRELSKDYPDCENCFNETLIRVVGLTNNKVKNASFSLNKGEILGITGLVGAGRTELVRMLFGADDYIGDIYIKGKKASIKSPTDAIRHGISLLPEDRKLQGLLLQMSVLFNVSISSLKDLVKSGFINRQREKAVIEKYVQAIKIKTPGHEQLVKNLSGGNQQKVILAKWLATNADIFIFDEPTRGIDVGAKAEIYHLMNELVKSGKSIIMVSSELPELIGMSDRVLVMHDGEIAGEVMKKDITQELLLSMASGEKGATA